jgi:hypothetical protein
MKNEKEVRERFVHMSNLMHEHCGTKPDNFKEDVEFQSILGFYLGYAFGLGYVLDMENEMIKTVIPTTLERSISNIYRETKDAN